MLATFIDTHTSYAVEVSGWDSNETFFVEKTELQWSAEKAKLIHMKHAVASGALLFLRLIDARSTDRVHPVTYVAERVAAGDAGQFDVQLAPARGRNE